MAEAENRFKALIQPIKDIASNWDIDIAESLTEYLEELDSLRISIDGGKSNLNFAEAALLIQGSTAVYSKKVEYLHQLVLQSLEFITNKKTAGTTQSKVHKSNDPDEFMLLDADESFLLLDNFVEEGHNINLKTTDESVSNSRLSNSLSGIADTSKVSMSLMHSLLNDDQGSTGLKLVSCAN
jgi:condensin-2 complex subunit H2